MEATQLHLFGLNSYHNSVPERDASVIDQRENKCRKQEELIFSVFKINKEKDFTAFEMWVAVGQIWPKASVQRAITNLCNQDKIFFTGVKRKGEFDVFTNTWKIK